MEGMDVLLSFQLRVMVNVSNDNLKFEIDLHPLQLWGLIRSSEVEGLGRSGREKREEERGKRASERENR